MEQTSLNKDKIIHTLRKKLPYLRMRFGVTHMALYGSFAKGGATAESDIDLLVELSRPLGFEFVTLATYLEEILGRKVDLVTFETLERSMDHPRYRSVAEDVKRTLTNVPTG